METEREKQAMIDAIAHSPHYRKTTANDVWGAVKVFAFFGFWFVLLPMAVVWVVRLIG